MYLILAPLERLCNTLIRMLDVGMNDRRITTSNVYSYYKYFVLRECYLPIIASSTISTNYCRLLPRIMLIITNKESPVLQGHLYGRLVSKIEQRKISELARTQENY